MSTPLLVANATIFILREFISEPSGDNPKETGSMLWCRAFINYNRIKLGKLKSNKQIHYNYHSSAHAYTCTILYIHVYMHTRKDSIISHRRVFGCKKQSYKSKTPEIHLVWMTYLHIKKVSRSHRHTFSLQSRGPLIPNLHTCWDLT